MGCGESRYWIGPHGVLVPESCLYVTAADGYNRHHRDGGVTELIRENAVPPTRQQWLEHYAERRNGAWYWICDPDG